MDQTRFDQSETKRSQFHATCSRPITGTWQLAESSPQKTDARQFLDKTYFIGIIHVTKVILDYRESKEIGGCKEHNIMPSSILTPSVRRSRTQRV